MAAPSLPNGAPPPQAPTLYDAIGKPMAPSNDPAWQPPKDPLEGVNLDQRARAISREIPIVVVATGWDVPQARIALQDLVIGLFDGPAQMADAVMYSDSRVQSALAARLSILGRPVEFRLPAGYEDSALAQECLDAFVDAWPTMAAESRMGEMQRWAIMMGFGPCQILWRMGKYAIPNPLPWHPRYTYWDWNYRALVAITMDGQEPIIGGDGHWMLHAPCGEYRGWMRGALGAITPWWLARHYALRDWARYSERHGLPMIKLKTPAVGDPTQQAQVRFQIQHLGQETVFHLPQNPPPALSYDVELMEAKDTAHEGFRLLVEQCNQEITLALLAQTLTSAMPPEGGSSYAAARVHAGVLQGLMEADARALAQTVHLQLARPFAAINFGNPDLAPRVLWDVTPYEDAKTKASTLLAFAQAIAALHGAGVKVKDLRRLAKDLQIDLGAVEEIAAQPAPGAVPPEREGKPEGRARIAAPFAGYRFEPHTSTRVRVADEDEALREAMAWADHERDEQRVRRARRL